MKRREAIKTALKGLAFVGACALGVKPQERKPDDVYEVTVYANGQVLNKYIAKAYDQETTFKQINPKFSQISAGPAKGYGHKA